MYKEALNILNILNDKGFDSYIVGGFVRDKLLGITNEDIDIITSAKPDEISNIFNVDIIDNYGSIKLKYNNYNFDITTFRKEDNYIDNRRPKDIEFVLDVKEDLLRRDFTINTILIDKDGNYIDYLNGIEDLNNKLIRCVGNSDKKIKEDALRILRALRFMCIYNFNLEDDLLLSIKNNKELISNLSFDRIKKELDIIFSSLNVNIFFDMVSDIDLYKILEIKPINRVIATGNNLSIWAQLEYSDNYNFSNVDRWYIRDLKYILENGVDNYTIYKYGKLINKEANKILGNNIDVEKVYETLPIYIRKHINITSDEILKITNEKSKINEIYMDLEKQILYNNLKNNKKDIISYLEGEYNE